MISIIALKPSFIYDHDKFKFKEFGFKKNKSFLSIGSIGIFSAFFIAILLVLLGTSDEKENKPPNIQYVQIPTPQYMPQMPQYIPQMQQIPQMPQVIYQQIPIPIQTQSSIIQNTVA
jgi:hypothetical protein